SRGECDAGEADRDQDETQAPEEMVHFRPGSGDLDGSATAGRRQDAKVHAADSRIRVEAIASAPRKSQFAVANGKRSRFARGAKHLTVRADELHVTGCSAEFRGRRALGSAAPWPPGRVSAARTATFIPAPSTAVFISG